MVYFEREVENELVVKKMIKDKQGRISLSVAFFSMGDI